MNCDDSTAEIKLTDVTHCDLETKSILKPRKVRAPLQEVDLGNQVTVEFDVIRKRKVSFAGVNIIKEFNSEAKSFCIYNTPAYEEKVSTSSDSSALSASLSGNIQISTKENDITIFLEDTMDLTDLSISQPSCAMDITKAKPQGCLPDIFATKNQERGTIFGSQISDKKSDHPVLHSENDNFNFNPDPFQAFNRQKMEKPINSPPVTDPTKMLIKELLEDSMVDFHVDKSLKASSLFMQNKFLLMPNTNTHDLGDSNCLSADSRKTPGMDFTNALPKLMNELPFSADTYDCARAPAKFDTHCNLSSRNMPNLFGAQQVHIEESNSAKLFQNNESQMDFTEDIPKPFSKVIFPLNSVQSEIQQKLIDSSQPSQKIISQNPFNVISSQGAVKEELNLIKGFQSNVSQMDFTEDIPPLRAKAFQNPVIHSQNTESEAQKALRSSQMEFNETLPSKNIHMVQQNIGVENLNSEIKLPINNMPPMKFREALPSCNIRGASDIMEKKDDSFNINNFMYNKKTNSHTLKDSNIEFTEDYICTNANPVTDILSNKNDKSLNSESQIFLKQSDKMLYDPKQADFLSESHLIKSVGGNLEKEKSFLSKNANIIIKRESTMAPGRNHAVDTSVMEFTEALPLWKPVSNQLAKNQMFEEEIKENMRVNRNCHQITRKSTAQISNCTFETSHMEFTEAIPQLNPAFNQFAKGQDFEEEIKENVYGGSNVHITKRKSIMPQNDNYAENTSCMEFTEAIPQFKPAVNQFAKGQDFEEEIKENVYGGSNVQLTKRKSIMPPNDNYDENTSCMEFTEAIPQLKPAFNQFAKGQDFEEDIKENVCGGSNVHITKRKSIMPPNDNYAENTSCMEFTEAIPQFKPAVNQFAKGQDFEEDIKENVCGGSNVQLTKRKSIMPPNDNYAENTSCMEFTEAIPQLKPAFNQFAKGQDFEEEIKENVYGGSNVHITKRKSIMPPNENYADSTSCMEFTEAIPQLKPAVNQFAKGQDFEEDIKENVYGGSNVHITKRKSIMPPNDNYAENTSCMEFTEAIPQLKPAVSQFANGQEFKEEIKENVCGGSNVHITKRKSIMPPNDNYAENTSCMEFTEAIPQFKPAVNQFAKGQDFEEEIKENVYGGSNVQLTKRKSIMPPNDNYDENTSCMEFTEAIPQLKPAVNQFAKGQDFEEDIKENVYGGSNVHITKRKSIMPPNDNYAENTSCMEFTEAIPQLKPAVNQFANGQEFEEEIKENVCGGSNVHITKRKSIMPPNENYADSTSCMEFTEAIPQLKPAVNQFAKGQDFEEDIKENVYGGSNVHITKRKSIMPPNENYAGSTSCMEFTEAIPQLKPAVNQFANGQEFEEEIKENVCGGSNVHMIKRKSLFPPNENYAENTSCMEFTEAIPQLKPAVNQFAKGQDFEEDIKENVCGGSNVHITKRTSIMPPNDNYAEKTSCMEFIEAIPQLKPAFNQFAKGLDFEEDIKENMSVGSNVHITKRKSIMPPNENYADSTSCMEFTEAIPQLKPAVNQFANGQEFEEEIKENVCGGSNVHMIKRKSLFPPNENYADSTLCMDFTEGTSYQLNNSQEFEKEVKENVCDDMNVHKTNRKSIIALNVNHSDITSHKEFTNVLLHGQHESNQVNSKALVNGTPQINSVMDVTELDPVEQHSESSKNISEVELNNENMPQVSNPMVASPHKDIQLNYTEPMQLQSKKNLEHDAVAGFQNDNCKSVTLADNDIYRKVNKTCEVLFTEVMKDADQVQINDLSISTSEIVVNNSTSLNNINENLGPEKDFKKINFVIGCPMSDVYGTIESSRSLLQEIDITNLSMKNKAPSETEIGFPVQSHLKCPNEINQISFSKKANEIESTLVPVIKGHEAASEIRPVSPNSCTNGLFSENGSRIDVDQLNSPTPDNDAYNDLSKKSATLGTIRSNNILQPHSEYNIPDTSVTDNNILEMEQGSPKTCLLQERNIQKCDPDLKLSNDNYESVKIADSINVLSVHGQKKNLVHFNTPPVRSIIKKRKTLGPDQSRQLTQSIRSNLSECFNYESDMSDVSNKPLKKGLFDEIRKSLFDSDKGKEEWERLVKNDSFMKVNEFEFVSTTKWKYKFKWPVELFLEIPQTEVDQSTRKKSITLVSKISKSDQLSIFVDTCMKKKLGVILSEKWLNSHCKTIKDLLVTIKFVEQEYSRLEPLITSLNYFYQEFPFDFKDGRVVFTIVNLRKKYCFEVRIDVNYGLVKGKNIDVINRVGHISKTKVQQLFDQLQPNTEQFFLFWQKLKKGDML